MVVARRVALFASIASLLLAGCGSTSSADNADGGANDGASATCAPRTCQELGASCGPQGDGCGAVIPCGACNSPLTCGGSGTPSQCGAAADGGPCVPETCLEFGYNCGPAGDGCGGLLQCGSCSSPETCGGGGQPSVCGTAGGGDAGGNDGSSGGIGQPCETGAQCTGGVCLGAPFGGGYCTERIAECAQLPPDAGQCPQGSACENAVIAAIDGGQADGDFCLATCQQPSDCRSGYSCCKGGLGAMGFSVLVCQPPSLCR